MINFPKSTELRRYIPKEKFYSKTAVNSKLRQLFTDEIDKIYWTNKISPDTLNISSKDYREVHVFEITLKSNELSRSVLKHIDAFIPYPILFIVKRMGAEKAVISFKEPSSSGESLMKVDVYYETAWTNQLDLELKGRSVDEIYKHLLAQVSPDLKSVESSNTKEVVEMDKERQKILKQIEALTKRIEKEPSTAKRQEMSRERHELRLRLN